MPGRYHVLIVEDDLDLRTLYTIRLMHEGYQVTAVENEACALAQVTAGNIDLVLTDWYLPTRSGVELITTLQHLHPTVKTILMSNHTDLEQATNACTPDGRFHKLALFTQLLELLHTLLPAKVQVMASMALAANGFSSSG